MATFEADAVDRAIEQLRLSGVVAVGKRGPAFEGREGIDFAQLPDTEKSEQAFDSQTGVK